MRRRLAGLVLSPATNSIMHPINLEEPAAPPRLTREQAIASVKRNYGYPRDMPDDVWIARYGSYPHPSPYVDAVDVWEVTLGPPHTTNYFVPGAGVVPSPTLTFVVYLDDKEGGVFLARISE